MGWDRMGWDGMDAPCDGRAHRGCSILFYFLELIFYILPHNFQTIPTSHVEKEQLLVDPESPGSCAVAVQLYQMMTRRLYQEGEERREVASPAAEQGQARTETVIDHESQPSHAAQSFLLLYLLCSRSRLDLCQTFQYLCLCLFLS